MVLHRPVEPAAFIRTYAVEGTPREHEAAAPTQINIVLNWLEELKRSVPPGKDP